MKQKNAINSLLYLISFSFLAKLLSIIAKIITTRAVGKEGMGIFSLVSPIMLLLYTLGQIGLPTTISKLISANYEKRYKIMITSLILGSIINLILILILYISAPFIASSLLNNQNTIGTIYMLGLLTPLVFLSGIIKGFLFGSNRIKISSISQVIEELGRIIFILLFFNYIGSLNAYNASMFAIIGLIVAEVFQILTQIIGNYRCFDKNYPYFKNELKDKTNYIFKEIIEVSLPITANRFITSFTYFLEPIILTFILTKLDFSSDYIAINYGLLESYAMPILFLPGFFSAAFSTYLLPNMSKAISKGNFSYAKKIFITLTFFSAIIGLLSAIICFFFPEFLLNLLYGNIDAKEYVRMLSFPFIIYYIESPINTAMVAMSLDKKALLSCIVSSILRIVSLFIFIPSYNVFGTALSTLVEVIVVVGMNLFFIHHRFKDYKRIIIPIQE